MKRKHIEFEWMLWKMGDRYANVGYLTVDAVAIVVTNSVGVCLCVCVCVCVSIDYLPLFFMNLSGHFWRDLMGV